MNDRSITTGWESEMQGWDKLAQWAGALPGVPYVSDGVSRGTVTHLMGFWVLWNIYGGQHEMEAAGWAPSSVYRSRALFKKIFGCDVGDFLPVHAEMLRCGDAVVKRYVPQS